MARLIKDKEPVRLNGKKTYTVKSDEQLQEISNAKAEAKAADPEQYKKNIREWYKKRKYSGSNQPLTIGEIFNGITSKSIH